MHNKPHSEEAKAKMKATREAQPKKWAALPEKEIVQRLLETAATARSLAKEFSCSDSTIKVILRKHTTIEQRLKAKADKQAKSLTGYQHSGEFKEKSRQRMLGQRNSFFGKKHDDNFKEAQSKRKTGLIPSHETRVKLSVSGQGISAENWTGFISTDNELARRNTKYAQWRKAVYERDKYTCRMCGKRGNEFHAHHIKTFSKYPTLRYETSNGVTLCANPCHKKTIGHEEDFEYLFRE